MFTILGWIIFGLIVGLIAKAIHPGDEPVGFLQTVGIGIAGSFVGGFINYILGTFSAMSIAGFSNHRFSPSGFIMSVVGGVLFCIFWRWYSLKNSSSGPKSFFNGKNLR